MIRALFLDVDGTLISFRTHRVPQSAVEALCRARDAGARLFIATGRAVTDLALLEEIPYDGVVALNGSECVMRDGKVIARHRIPQPEFERALELADKWDFPVALELNDGIFVNRITPVVEELSRMIDHPVPQAVDLRRLFERGDCCQMCFYIDPELEKRVMASLPMLSASRWCPIFADVNLRGIDKATGVAEFASAFGFDRPQIMTFGDGGNDVPMLRAAGIGVAMGNACQEALEAADWVTSSVDDDGIRRALEHFGVIEASETKAAPGKPNDNE